MSSRRRLPGLAEFAAAIAIAGAAFGAGLWLGRSSVPTEPLVDEAHWSGAWLTESEIYEDLCITLLQDDNHVVGSYSWHNMAGKIEATVQQHSLVGLWSEKGGGKALSGRVTFVLLPGGDRFIGVYTRDWEGNRSYRLWTGERGLTRACS